MTPCTLSEQHQRLRIAHCLPAARGGLAREDGLLLEEVEPRSVALSEDLSVHGEYSVWVQCVSTVY